MSFEFSLIKAQVSFDFTLRQLGGSSFVTLAVLQRVRCTAFAPGLGKAHTTQAVGISKHEFCQNRCSSVREMSFKTAKLVTSVN